MVRCELCSTGNALHLGDIPNIRSVGVPQALLLQAKGPDELLALSGLNSRADFTWEHHVFLVANKVRRTLTQRWNYHVLYPT